jgi:hypothetical protein
MPDAFRSLACPSCPRYHTGARGMLCCRCWERLTPEGRAYKARRVRETRARAKARAEAAAAALEQQDDKCEPVTLGGLTSSADVLH